MAKRIAARMPGALGQKIAVNPDKWLRIIHLFDAHCGYDYALRIKAVPQGGIQRWGGIHYQVLVDGWCGPEVITSGQLAISFVSSIWRVELPIGVLAGRELALEVKPLSQNFAIDVRAEITWIEASHHHQVGN